MVKKVAPMMLRKRKNEKLSKLMREEAVIIMESAWYSVNSIEYFILGTVSIQLELGLYIIAKNGNSNSHIVRSNIVISDHILHELLNDWPILSQYTTR